MHWLTAHASTLARVAGFIIAGLGVIGLIAPSSYVQLGWFWAESPGLYLVSAVQIVIGFVLLRAAPSSRSPIGLGVIGAFAIVEAVLVPLLGHGRARAVAHWFGSQAMGTLRLWAMLELAIGILIVLAVTPRRPPLRVRPGV
jgi:hypothetical protein